MSDAIFPSARDCETCDGSGFAHVREVKHDTKVVRHNPAPGARRERVASRQNARDEGMFGGSGMFGGAQRDEPAVEVVTEHVVDRETVTITLKPCPDCGGTGVAGGVDSRASVWDNLTRVTEHVRSFMDEAKVADPSASERVRAAAAQWRDRLNLAASEMTALLDALIDRANEADAERARVIETRLAERASDRKHATDLDAKTAED